MSKINLDTTGVVQSDGTFMLESYDPNAVYISKNGIMSVFKKNTERNEYIFSELSQDPSYMDKKDYICVWSK